MNTTLFNRTKLLVNVLFYSLFLIVFSQCKTSSKKTAIPNESAQNSKVDSNTITDNPKVIQIKPFNDPSMKKSKYSLWNDDKTMELVIERESKPGEPVYHFTYQVIKKDTKEKIKEGRVTGTALEWNDTNSLKLTPYIGMIEKPRSLNPDKAIPAQTQVLIIKLN